MAKIPINITEGTLSDQSNEQMIIGIDLGTTNSLVAYVDGGIPKVVKDPSGYKALIPSILYFSPCGDILVGEEAKKHIIADPSRTIYSVKRLMGKSYQDLGDTKGFLGYRILDDDKESLVKIEVDGKYYTPIELSAEILKYLKLSIEQHLNTPVSKAVITVPAYFNETQRQATRDAGKLAGLDVLRIVNEPTAASLAYGLNKNVNEIIAVYDLGGGTFDLTILKIEDGVFEVLATGGDTFLGGDDIDQSIMKYWDQFGTINLDKIDRSDKQSLRLLAEQAKTSLSKEKKYSSIWQGANLELDQAALGGIMDPLISKTIELCAQVIEDAKIEKNEIDHVIMVGGSTRSSHIKDRVSEFFERKVNDDLDPDKVVAMGAAVQANILAGKQKDILLLDVTPLSLGIETIGGLMDTMVTRNSTVPCALAREYTTSVDGQINLKISVYQGERELVEDNRKLGEFILSNIPPMPAGIPKIEVRFVIDADGILQVSARELRSGTVQSISITSQYGISEEEMATMLLQSIQKAEIDMSHRSTIEAVNEGNALNRATDKFLNQNTSWLTAPQVNKIISLKNTLIGSIKAENKEDIHTAIDSLNTYTTPLAQEAIEQTIKNAIKGQSIK